MRLGSGWPDREDRLHRIYAARWPSRGTRADATFTETNGGIGAFLVHISSSSPHGPAASILSFGDSDDGVEGLTSARLNAPSVPAAPPRRSPSHVPPSAAPLGAWRHLPGIIPMQTYLRALNRAITALASAAVGPRRASPSRHLPWRHFPNINPITAVGAHRAFPPPSSAPCCAAAAPPSHVPRQLRPRHLPQRHLPNINPMWTYLRAYQRAITVFASTDAGVVSRRPAVPPSPHPALWYLPVVHPAIEARMTPEM
ncbi:hypothetical protein DFH09DRAFT_1316454 [Mycena vulgaris]|nr:hypothetical protein DFH09DRAFT_1316454 [Mycena vulgaris]